MRLNMLRTTLPLALLFLVAFTGCGENARLLNPSFVNFQTGGVHPLAPGQPSNFVLIRCVNRTDSAIEFLVTVEREVPVEAEDQTAEDELGVTIESETFRLQTGSTGLQNEIGILIDCPIIRVGLGENLNFPFDEPGLFVADVEGVDIDVTEGFGVPGGVFPLDARAGNFTCGDTIIFEARTRTGVPGSVLVQTFVLPAITQPDTFSGPDTFNNARALLERQFPEEE